MLENTTKTQHFVSQVEQRFNAIDKSLPRHRQRIYKFEIIEPDQNVIRLVDNDGIKIKKNLAYKDLFSFDKSGELRKNFEDLFQEYEGRISDAISTLQENIQSRSNVSGQVIDGIWDLKFLNILRNPYGAKKFLNTFPALTSYVPTDLHFLECQHSIDKLQKDDLFEDFPDLDLSLEEYRTWLKGLLLLLMPSCSDQTERGEFRGNIFKQLTYDLLTDTTKFRAIKIHALSENFPGRFLLSDRSYFYGTEANDKKKLTLSFNITDRMSLTYMLVEPSEIIPEMGKHDLRVPFFNEEILNATKTAVAKDIQLRIIHDNEQEVKQFNEQTIFQAKKHVFCSRKDVMGATVMSADWKIPGT